MTHWLAPKRSLVHNLHQRCPRPSSTLIRMRKTNIPLPHTTLLRIIKLVLIYHGNIVTRRAGCLVVFLGGHPFIRRSSCTGYPRPIPLRDGQSPHARSLRSRLGLGVRRSNNNWYVIAGSRSPMFKPTTILQYRFSGKSKIP